jgi:alpha-L-rhamnosidase
LGLLQSSDWTASWIEAGYPEDSIERPSPLLRKTFRITKPVREATLFITALGMYQAFLNGTKTGNDQLTPGWTSYQERVQYQQYKVTDQLHRGDNAIGVMLGSGWYRGYIGFSGQKDFYGKKLALKCQLDIVYEDGTRERVNSDDSWQSSTGSVRSSEIYNGEKIDARKEQVGWTTAGFPAESWAPVRLRTDKVPEIVATVNTPVRKKESFKPKKIFTTPRGEKVIDFGQNLVGWVQLQLSGKAGDSITLSHAEVLDKQGNFYTDNLRAARQQNTYILRGDSIERFEPHFTFQGFRYIRIDDWKGDVRPEMFTAVALYSDMPVTGSFTCSDPLVNQLQQNILWGQKGNFLDVPTDCPQRDERLGWTGDAQAFARTATFNMDVQAFFAKWLKDLAADQFDNGGVPFVIPNVLGPGAGNACGWADAATIIPWTMYLAYGDKKILEQQYESMKAWVGYITKVSKNNLWNSGFHFGDWLFYTMDNDVSGRAAVTDKYLLAQCFYAYSVEIMAKTAKVLGRSADQQEYEALLAKVRDAFMKEYVTPNGRITSNTQTAYTLALHMDMLPEALRAQAANRLAENVKEYGNHLTTGFLGTPYLCHVLSRFGHNDVAYTLLLQQTYPSWLYPVKMGATTIWERWNGIKPDSTFETESMNSFNHYAYGAIGDWLYRVVAGIDTDPEKPGYAGIVIRPQPDRRLSHARADMESPYGKITSAWKIEKELFELQVTIPHNTEAKIYIPAKQASGVMENGAELSKRKEIHVEGFEAGYLVISVGSGSYRFTSSWTP